MCQIESDAEVHALRRTVKLQTLHFSTAQSLNSRFLEGLYRPHQTTLLSLDPQDQRETSQKIHSQDRIEWDIGAVREDYRRLVLN